MLRGKNKENLRYWIFQFTKSCQITSVTYFAAFIILKFHNKFQTNLDISSPSPGLLILLPLDPSPPPTLIRAAISPEWAPLLIPVRPGIHPAATLTLQRSEGAAKQKRDAIPSTQTLQGLLLL